MAKKYTKDPYLYNEEVRFRKIYKAAKLIKFLLNVEIQVEGLDNVPESPVLFLANHKSSFDPIAIFLTIYKKKTLPLVTFVSKKELTDSKMIFAIITLINGIVLDRENLRQALDSTEIAKKTLSGYKKDEETFTAKSVCVFPEGTRVPEGEFKEFKNGALKPAYQAYKPIVPVTIVGTRGIVDKISEKKKKFGHKVVKVIFSEKIDPSSFFTISSEIVANKVRDKIISKYK